MSFNSYKSLIFTLLLGQNLVLKGYSVGLKKEKKEKKEVKIVCRVLQVLKASREVLVLCLHCSIKLIHRAMGLVLQAGQFRQSINKDCLATNVDSSFFPQRR